MRRSAILACCWLAACATAGAADVREEALVRRVQWPVLFEPRVPGGCDGLAPDDVVIREDGVHAPVGALERRRIPAVHALVIDNSASMNTRLDAAKAAALAYLERLPPDEPAMLATFSDSLVLDHALTTDRDALAEAMEKIEPQAYTALDTAVYYAVNHLSTRPERKILVLLSDGCDTASMAGHSLRAVGDITADVPNLSVFPIGIDLPARCSGSLLASRLDSPRLPLQKLARDTGGEMYETQHADGLGEIFDRIFKRLQNEGFVSYRPLYHGEGPRDVPGETLMRRVKVESARPKSCRIRSAGPLRRAEHPPARESRIAATEGKIVYRDWWSEAGEKDEALGRMWLRGDSMVGHGADVEREAAWLYLAVPFHFEGKYRTARDYDVRFVTRDFVVEVPAFERLRETAADPRRLLIEMLRSGDRPFVPVPGVESRRGRAHRWLGEKWIHGHTLLELRGTLAHGLFSYDGYREFAYEKARQAYRKEMREMLATSADMRALPTEDRTRLEHAIEGHRPEPTDAQLQRFLAGWLGDLRAHDLVVDVEEWTVNLLLDPARREEGEALLETIDKHWSDLKAWFPPPTQVRVVAPLVPQYDTERDVVGFWRIVLPEVAAEEPPEDRIPDRPLALTLLRDRALSGIRIEQLRYGWEDEKRRRRLFHEARRRGLLGRRDTWRTTPAITMSVAAGDAESATLTVLWNDDDDPPVPVCLAFDGARDPGFDALLGLAPACDGGAAN